jgi:hypothetical protein
MLDSIQKALALGMAQTAWATDYELRAELVSKYRRYRDGDHDAQMTPEMKKAMRVAANTEMSPFNSNKCDDVIQTMADRLSVDRIEGDNDPATEWAQSVLDYNRFDGFQMDVHESTLVDGDSYVLVEFDNDDQMPKLCHEPAWNGINGMLVVYKHDNRQDVACAIKVWNETVNASADTMRVNYYYPDRIEKYIGTSGGQLTQHRDPDDTEWPIPWNEEVGVPVIPFRNKARGNGGFGLSELHNVLPLQDALNRDIHSMVMAAELTAFPIYFAKGFIPTAALTPGMIFTVTGEGGMPLEEGQDASLNKIEGSDLKQYIDQAGFFEAQIESVSRTPSMMSNSNLSGEAMKQSEVKLLGKVKRFQVKGGNSWEDVMALAHRIQTAYGTGSNPPAVKRWTTRWMDAQIRNDKEVVEMATKIADRVGPEEFLRMVAPVYRWDETRIQQIVAEAAAVQQRQAANLIGGFNSFQ